MIDPRRRARQIAALACFVLGLVGARPARAEETTNRRLVVVLRPSPGAVETWPEGTQAVVAELVAGGYELMLRASSARDRDGLLRELGAVASEKPVLGAVVVVREGERGIAFVYTVRSGTTEIETGIAEGAVGEGAVALRITQLLGPPRLVAPAERVLPAPRNDARPRPVAAGEPPRARSSLVAVAGGLVFSSDLPEPLPVAGLGARRRLVGPLLLDAAAALSLGASRIEAAGGTIDVSAQEVTLHLAFELLGDDHFALSLGLGGGAVWTHGTGEASEGFVGSTDSATVALLSARAAATFTHNDWSLLLGVDPGVLLPAVDVATGGSGARLGRPWTTASVGLAWNF